jgi:hypothetical protein
MTLLNLTPNPRWGIKEIPELSKAYKVRGGTCQSETPQLPIFVFPVGQNLRMGGAL